MPKRPSPDFRPARAWPQAAVTDATGTQQIEVRKDKDKNYYAKSSVVEGIYKVTSDVGDGLDKGMDDFRNKKLFDFGFNDPSKLEIHNGTAQATYQKSGEKWMSGAKQMDAPSIQSLVDKLRDLTSTKFLDFGNGPAIFEAHRDLERRQARRKGLHLEAGRTVTRPSVKASRPSTNWMPRPSRICRRLPAMSRSSNLRKVVKSKWHRIGRILRH